MRLTRQESTARSMRPPRVGRSLAVRRTLVALGCTLVATVAGGAAVAAQEYPTRSGSLTVDGGDSRVSTTPDDPELVEPTQAVRIAGGGFVPGSEVTVTIESDPILLVVTTADANGEIDVLVNVPENVAIGEHTIKATGDGASGGRLVLARPVSVVTSIADAVAGANEAESDSLSLGAMTLLIGVAIAAAAAVSYTGWTLLR